MTHSVVVIEQGKFDDVAVGDVIAFRADSIGKQLAFHRVIHVLGDSFITKGDNNPIADGQKVTRDSYIGREVFHTNWTAYYIQELTRPYGYIRTIILPILAIIMLVLAIHFFRRWPADTRLKRLVASVILLGVSITALVAYSLWDSSRISFLNDKLTETADQFQSSISAGISTTVNNREVIGAIEIPAIDLKYPIINYENDSSLNISISKYTGPSLGETGNVVLLGHKSSNGGNLFFTNIDHLQIGDVVIITTFSGENVEYKVESYSVHPPDDLSVLDSDSDRKELTLISCTPDMKNRYIVKAVSEQ